MTEPSSSPRETCPGCGPYSDHCDGCPAGLVQVGWMLSPELAAEFDVTPLSDDYLITLEQAEHDGGIKPEFVDRVIPVYRKATDSVVEGVS